MSDSQAECEWADCAAIPDRKHWFSGAVDETTFYCELHAALVETLPGHDRSTDS